MAQVVVRVQYKVASAPGKAPDQLVTGSITAVANTESAILAAIQKKHPSRGVILLKIL